MNIITGPTVSIRWLQHYNYNRELEFKQKYQEWREILDSLVWSTHKNDNIFFIEIITDISIKRQREKKREIERDRKIIFG